MKTVNVLLIGLGPHARRIYVPALFAFASDLPVRLVAAVDLKRQKDTINTYLQEQDHELEMLYLDSFDPKAGIPDHARVILDALVEKFDIQGVVISTEPTVHKAYAEWALSNGLNILMDKPVSARKRISLDATEAKGLIDDYYELLDIYNAHQSDKPTLFSINVQRRYDYGFDKVRELIAETTQKFNMPITSMQIMHADGSWRFPKEILTQESHGLSDGFGKVSHSGYHLFDMAWQLYKTSLVPDKQPDSLEIFSSTFNPTGLDVCINENDYIKYFGDEFERTGLTSQQYIKTVGDYGEMDSFNVIRLMKRGSNICNISVNLLHSSFSRRSWALPNADLYKGKGRVKHQQFIIQQGPFQCIQIHNYQSKHEHDVDNSNEFGVGGNNHFDIYVFRNVGMYGEGEAFTKISSQDLEKQADTAGLTIENAKYRIIREFIEFMLGNITIQDVKSNINTHEIPVKIMSGVCQSSANMHTNNNPLIGIAL
ncbi:MAG TPA: Gfo/Idh/MocA family oxidoreductase [Candidatus Dormibacteraeota bacterium]|nr:Gfo/Idh/MocA family oxidoreductase [Candidatus Dormibacteraeota bacterium]